MIVVLSGAAIAGVIGAYLVHRDRKATEVHTEELLTRLGWHPARGLLPGDPRVVLGEPMLGLSPAPAPALASGSVVNAVVTGLPARGELDARPACHGRMSVHRDGTTTCTAGRDDCWGGDGAYSHQSRHVCTDLSHGCGVCDVVGDGS